MVYEKASNENKSHMYSSFGILFITHSILKVTIVTVNF